jgi:trans-aconitate methyltransferase
MVRFARDRFKDRFPSLSFEQADAAALRFDNEFDVIFSNAALHWVQDHVSVVQGIARALRPGGRVLLSMGGQGNVAEVIAAVQELIQQPTWAHYFKDWFFTYAFHPPKHYQEWLTGAGLEPVRLELVPKDMVHTPEKFTAWIRTTWLRYTQRVPEYLRDRFVAEFVARHLP